MTEEEISPEIAAAMAGFDDHDPFEDEPDTPATTVATVPLSPPPALPVMDENTEQSYLLALMEFIADLRAFTQLPVLNESKIQEYALAWVTDVAVIPLNEIERRDQFSISARMKRRGLVKGSDMLAVWQAMQGDRAQSEATAEAERAIEQEYQNTPVNFRGPGAQQLLAYGRHLGWNGTFHNPARTARDAASPA